MHKKFQWRRYLVALFTGIFSIAGLIVAIDAPARAANTDLGYNSDVDWTAEFNGTSQYFASNGSQQVIPATGDFTMEAWFKEAANVTGSRVILGQGTASNFSNRFQIGLLDSGADRVFRLWQRSSGDVSQTLTSVVVSRNAWHHIAVVNTAGSNYKIYLDGTLIETISNVNTTSHGGIFYVGRNYDGGYLFSGQIDEVRIWNDARTLAEIQTDMHSYADVAVSDKPRAYFDFNEGALDSHATYDVFNRASDDFDLIAYAAPVFRDVKSVSELDGRKSITFPRTYLTPSGGWRAPATDSGANVLVVAGGGAGGSGGDSVGAGGGGAGGFLEGGTRLQANTVFKVVVGLGGSPDRSTWWKSGFNGQDSKFGANLLAVGGGGGGGRASAGSNGGSGGGSGGRYTTTAGGTATVDQGSAGGSAPSAQFSAGSGGGGAGSAGQVAVSASGGTAGTGKTTSISGAPVTYSAGGRGGDKSSSAPVNNASANSGNGGAGSGGGFTQAVPTSTWGVGAAGGSGIVVISFAPADDKALNLSSVSTYAKNTTSQLFPSATSLEYTLEVWVKPTSTPSGHQPIITTPGDSSFGSRFYLGTYLGDGAKSKIHLAIGNASFNSTRYIPSDAWTHLAVSVGATSTSLFINGTLDYSQAFSRVSHPLGINLGSSDNVGTTQFFNGQLDQVKLWYAALDASKITRSMHSYLDTDLSGEISSTLQQAFDFNSESNGTYTSVIGSATLSKIGAPTLEPIVQESTSASNTTYKFPRTILTAWNGWLVPATEASVSYLAVGGGGGGGVWVGAGGAGAQVVENDKATSALSITAGNFLAVQVGMGGLGAFQPSNYGTFSMASSGQVSKIGTSVTALAGGNGASWTTQSAGSGSAGSIANGGGGAAGASSTTGHANNGSALAGIGFAGGVGSGWANGYPSGGGGGAGGAGISGTTTSAGNGGTGVFSQILGSRLGGGGGGGLHLEAGTMASVGSGVDGGGSGAINVPDTGLVAIGGLGTANTGGGGGGSGSPNGAGSVYSSIGGSGGSGVVAVTLKTADIVTFDKNDVSATGSMSTQYVAVDSSSAITTNSFELSGYTFAGWATSQNGSVVYTDGQSFNPSGDTILYAKWTVSSFAITYANGGGTGTLPTQTNVNSGSTFTVASGSALSKSNYTFAGWSDGTNTYQAAATYPAVSQSVTLTATWTLNNYAVTYANGGGTGTLPTQANVNHGSTFSVAAGTGLSRTGYAFAGWSDGSTVYQGSATYPAVSAAVTLTATWTANTLNVTWDSNSGTSVAGTTTTSGATIASAPTAPTRAGYAFAGWYQESGLTTQAVFPNFVHGKTENFTLYAKWTANPTRTVTYALAGGSSTLPTQSAIQDGLTFTVANTPVRFGYTFTGWSDGTSSYNQGATYTVGSSNITLTAIWSADTLNVTWNSNGGSSVTGTTTVTGGTIATAPTNPTKSGYNFDGWYKEVGLTNEAVFPNFVHGLGANFTLYAKWVAATFTITYKAGANGTGADIVQSFVFGNSATIKDETAPLTRAGYSISGWAASDAGAQSRTLSSSYSSAANIILYPVWSANTNAVTYDEQGGSSVSNGSFATGSTLALPAASVRSGYTFQGWYTAATGGSRLGSASATISPTATADLTVYAQWTANNYTVTYSGNSPTAGSVPTDNANYNIGSTIAVLGNSGNLTLTGYAFGGWTTAADGTGTVYNSGEGYVFGAANVTFYAKWLANTYTITYNTNGATSGAPTNATQTYTSGNNGITLTTVGSLVKTGYNFGGWATTPNGAALSGAYTTTANVTLYAVWNVKTVNVTYDRGLATSVATFPSNTTSIYGARYSISSMVSSIGTVGGAGLKFVGWSDGVSIYAAGEPYLVGETDVTFTAQWVHVYEVRYTLNGGTGVLLDSASCTTPNGSGGYVCTDGQPIAANQAPTKPGYNFTGWKDQSNNAIAAGASFSVNSGSYLLYAQWTPINYTVTYAANGGASTPTETSKNIGDIFTVANGITRTGYAFNGWSDGTRNYGAGASYQVGSTNVTLTAQWTANVYTITYDWNGGTGTATANSSYTVGTTGLTLPTVGDHVKDGYSFVGWSETRNGSAVSGAYQATQSRTLYAVWGPGSYTVTYNANGGTSTAASASVLNGGSALLPSATRANYVFEGWYSAQNGGSNQGMAAAVFTPSGSTTLYARWTQLSLYGINPAHLTRVGSLNASGIDSSYSGSNAGSSVQVTVPANTLPTGTTVNMDLVSDFTRAGNLLNDPANFIVSLVVSWVASDGTVPNTYSGKAVSVTIQNSSIKAGSSVYSILGSQVTLLGTAISDGTVTVSLTQDPEIVIAATRPTAPQTVTAVAGQTGTANVSWSAPSSTGGATITGYTVTASTGQTCSTATTSCAVTGLTAGASYTFTVTATNSVGTSLASAASSSLTLSGTPVSGPNLFTPIVKAPIVSNEKGQQILEVSQKKVATTGGSILKIETKNMDDISSVTVNGKKAKILGVVDGEIKLQMPIGTKGAAKLVFSGPTGNVTMEKVITFVAPKPVDVVASAAMPQGIWTIATPAVQALRKTLLANPDTVLINCVGYQSMAYNTPLDALVARQRAKTACQYLASQAPGVSVKTSVVRTKLTGPASRKLKVTFSAVR